MAIDIKRHKEKMNRDEPEIKLVPFIDILFTGAAAVTGDDTGTGTGKPNMTDTTGDAEYYLLPVAGLQKVVVNGVDMSSEIRGNAIGVHARVLDQGDVQIKTSEHAIYIQAPSGMSPQEAVHSPE